jgi:tetratricopeptide (TPR) repeat protein
MQRDTGGSWQDPAPFAGKLARSRDLGGEDGWAVEGFGATDEGEPWARDDVLETLSRLVDRSLVIADMPDDAILPHASAETRYRLLEMIRQYAREKLLASGESAAVRDRHLAFFAAMAAESEPALHGREQGAWLVRLDTELDNLRAAMAWAIGSRPLAALRIAGHLREFWTRRGLATEGRRWLSGTLQRVRELPAPAGSPDPERAQACALGVIAMATLVLAQGEYGPAFQAAQEGVGLARGTGEVRDLVHPLAMFAFIAAMSGHPAEGRSAAEELLALPRHAVNPVWVGMTLATLAQLAARGEGDYGMARRYLLESMAIARKAEDPWAEAMGAFAMGGLAYSQNDQAEARARYRESLAIWESTGERFFIQLANSGLADVARRQGDYDRAIELYREAFGRWQQVGNVGAIARCMECLAFIAAARGEAEPGQPSLLDHAARLLGAAEALREASASPMMPEERTEYEGSVSRLKESPDFAAAWRQGRALTRAQAVEYALCEDGLAADARG